MDWDVLFDDEFAEWFETLDEDLQDEIIARTNLVKQCGPRLGRPYVDTVEGSVFANMKELRVQHRGSPWRILFAFDAARAAILLVGGCKRGDTRWYKTQIPIADERFRRHLKRLER
ncbi:type II toxin-antitoxin system RelE/ParE family toxin [Isosphaeraceae bacterium EP7]